MIVDFNPRTLDKDLVESNLLLHGHYAERVLVQLHRQLLRGGPATVVDLKIEPRHNAVKQDEATSDKPGARQDYIAFSQGKVKGYNAKYTTRQDKANE